MVANLFLIGVPKAGTTTIYNLLKSSELVFCPTKKEPHYHSLTTTFDAYFPEYATPTRGAYEALYRGAEKFKWRVDASVTYAYSDSALKELGRDQSNKFIICLRKPSEAIHSMIRQRLRSLNPTKRDSQFLLALNEIEATGERITYPRNCFSHLLFDYKRLYDYREILDRIGNFLPEENLGIIHFEEVISYPEKVKFKIEKLLEVKLSAYPSIRHNEGYEVTENSITKLYASIHNLAESFIPQKYIDNSVIERSLRKLMRSGRTKISLEDYTFIKRLDEQYENIKQIAIDRGN